MTIVYPTDPLCSFGEGPYGPDTPYSNYWTEIFPIITPVARKIDNVFVVAKDVIKIIMSVAVVNNRFLNEILNYSVINMSGVSNSIVDRVMPIPSRTTMTISLHVKELKAGQTYKVTIKDSSIFDVSGVALLETSFTWVMRQTKIDRSIKTFAKLYNMKVGSTLRGLVEAMMISDEQIGGAF